MNPESSNKPTPPPRRSRPVQEKQGEVQSKGGSNPKSDNDGLGTSGSTKPPRPPPPDKPQHSTFNKNKEPLQTCRYTNEVSDSDSRKTTQLPPDPGPKLHPINDLDTHEDVGNQHVGKYTGVANPENNSTWSSLEKKLEPDCHVEDSEGQNTARKRDEDIKTALVQDQPEKDGKDEELFGEIEGSFQKAWNNLMIEIRCQGLDKILLNPAELFVQPIKLQFALCTDLRNEIICALANQEIQFHLENRCMVFTFNAAYANDNEKQLKEKLISNLNSNVLDNIDCVSEKRASEKGQNIMETIKKINPPLIRAGKILIYVSKDFIHIVGSKNDIRTFSANVLFEENQAREETRTSGIAQALIKHITQDEIKCLVELNILAEIEKELPGVKFHLSNEYNISGQNDAIRKGIALLNKARSTVVKKAVSFQDPFCAKAFINKTDGTTNDTLSEYIKAEVLKSRNVRIQKCHIEIHREQTSSIPTVTVCCTSKEEVDRAVRIVSSCLCSIRLSKLDVQKLLEMKDFEEWISDKMVYLFENSETECLIVLTNDNFKTFNMFQYEVLRTTHETRIPALTAEYFSEYGQNSFEKVKSAYKVSVNLSGNLITLSGRKKDIKEAKNFIKNIYARDSVDMCANKALIDQKKMQLEDISKKYQCCWQTQFYNCDEITLLADVAYKTSWLDHVTSTKLTVIEGRASRIEFDVLLVLVTNLLFPIISQRQLEYGYEILLEYSSEVGSKNVNEKRKLGSVGLLPQRWSSRGFRSKHVIYLVIQKANELQGCKNVVLPDNLGQTIKQVTDRKEVLSVGIPMDTENIDGTLSETELCGLFAKKWMDNWSQAKDSPELFFCSTSSVVINSIDDVFASSRGFSKRDYSAPMNDQSAEGDSVQVSVKKGSILNSGVDAIVNSTAKSLSLKKGFISNLILTHAGDTVEKECKKKHPKGIDYTEVVVTGPGRLSSVKNILHSALPLYSYETHDKVIRCVKNFVKNSLYRAEKLDVTSIAFPALGTGKLGYPQRDVANAMFDAVEDFKREAINPRLRQIFFMVHKGDELVCEAFLDAESVRLKQNTKRTRTSDSEIYLKRTINIEEAPIEFTVRVNKKYFPSYFVVMDFFKSESGNGKKIPAAWKDTLMSHRDIHDETSFKNMVKDVVTKAEEDRITGLVFYPLMNSGFGHSVGKQIEMFCDESKKINYHSPENQKKRYLREVWFAVDEAGFTNAENQLLSSTFMSSFTGRSSLWEKCQMKDAPNKMSVNVIGPTKEIVQSAITEMKIVLNQSDPQHRGKAEHRKPSEVKPSVAKEDYLSQGARPKQSGDIRVSGPIHQSTAENRVYLREDSSNEAKPANLDALEMTANVNQGIVDFLEGKGPNILSKWKMQVMKGFGVRFETDARKLTVLGTFPQLNVFQDYLYNDFPTFPEDKTSCKSLHDQSSHLDTEYMPELESAKFFSNCEDGIMFQYKIGSVRVIVYKGDITKIEADCIVSSATSNLTAKLGIERAIFKAAGDEVSKECKEFILKNKQLDPGKAIVTEGGRLKCKKIIHYVVQGSMTDIRKRVGDAMEICIEEAQNQRFRSIATPAIGQGSYGPSEGFGHGLHDAVSAYSSQRKEFPCVKWIHFVDRNEKSVSTVLKTFTRDFEYLRISQAVIYASEGDCTSVKADAVVLFQDSTLSINSSLAQKVTGLCDDLYSQKLETFKEQGPCIGSVYRIISSGDRPDVCKDVLLAVAIGDRLSETRNEKASSDEFKKLVNAVLVKCERWNVAKLCIPLFEIEGFNIAELTSVVAELVFEYFRTSEKSEVKEVYFLGEQQFVIRLVETLQKQFQKVEKWRTEKKLCTHHTELETMV